VLKTVKVKDLGAAAARASVQPVRVVRAAEPAEVAPAARARHVVAAVYALYVRAAARTAPGVPPAFPLLEQAVPQLVAAQAVVERLEAVEAHRGAALQAATASPRPRRPPGRQRPPRSFEARPGLAIGVDGGVIQTQLSFFLYFTH
jgi:hypothetical protein